MITPTKQQQEIIDLPGSVFVTACPGSGKTRVLVEKVISTLSHEIPPACRIAAVTFTHRAADEISSRLRESGYSKRAAWTGTIHAFALEWVLRPYSGYIKQLSRGFGIVDDYNAKKMISDLKPEFGFGFLDTIRAGFDCDGEPLAPRGCERELVETYRQQLSEKRLIDFDMVLYFAHELLKERPEIAKTLAAIFALVCIDEYQDTQELQYGILAKIVKAADGHLPVFVVGDKNQAIYTSLGGVAKTLEEIKVQFGIEQLQHRELDGNFRSTQRIVDFCGHFQDGGSNVKSLAKWAEEPGSITFCDQTQHKDTLATHLAKLVTHYLDLGIKPEEVCILAPRWDVITKLGRHLILHLDDVDLDAPGLSPLRYQPNSLWFQLSRLFLTEPNPLRFKSRYKWARDFVETLELSLGRELDEAVRRPRHILRICNDISCTSNDGLGFLDNVFEEFMTALDVELSQHPLLLEERTSFFEGARARLQDIGGDIDTSVDSLKKMFRHPAGIVVNTCHGIKGEEYEVVICVGVLHGYIPHWSRIINQPPELGREDARRILYVVTSRAKKYLHLIAEKGRVTSNNYPLSTTKELCEVVWDYDDLPFVD